MLNIKLAVNPVLKYFMGISPPYGHEQDEQLLQMQKFASLAFAGFGPDVTALNAVIRTRHRLEAGVADGIVQEYEPSLAVLDVITVGYVLPPFVDSSILTFPLTPTDDHKMVCVLPRHHAS